MSVIPTSTVKLLKQIYVLPVNPRLQPRRQPFRYPAHNRDYGVEQDFLYFLKRHQNLLSRDPAAARWHYLPIFWTRWHLNGENYSETTATLKKILDETLWDDEKTFTVCQFDSGPLVDLGKTIQMRASRQTATDRSIDIPLLCSAHRRTWFGSRKKRLASFFGRIKTHPIRVEMIERARKLLDCEVGEGLRSRQYAKKIEETYVTLCPRGFGGSSFRFFEAMQLGSVPFLIGDVDTRPFKKKIEWDEISFHSETPAALESALISFDGKRPHLERMGKKAQKVWHENLNYQKWCPLALEELESARC